MIRIYCVRSGDWVILDLPTTSELIVHQLSGKWKVIEYPVEETIFGFSRDCARLFCDKHGDVIAPRRYIRYDRYPEMKVIKR